MELGEEGDYIPIATLSPPDDSCIKMGSDESHFNVSFHLFRPVITHHHPAPYHPAPSPPPPPPPPL